jgi:hypothetical protein
VIRARRAHALEITIISHPGDVSQARPDALEIARTPRRRLALLVSEESNG